LSHCITRGFAVHADAQAMHCLKLEQQAGQLDRYISSRSYGRLHPRYKLGISSS
jgi:hypothetical protein